MSEFLTKNNIKEYLINCGTDTRNEILRDVYIRLSALNVALLESVETETKAEEDIRHSELNIMSLLDINGEYGLSIVDTDFPIQRCMARVWGKGYGSQCKHRSTGGSDLCKLHTKKSKICNIPCITDENGQRLGLFCGRIDQWQDDEEGILPYKDSNNKLKIRWKNENTKKLIQIDIENGYEIKWWWQKVNKTK